MKRSATAIRSQLLIFGAIVAVAAVAMVAATRPHANATRATLATQQPAPQAGAADAGMRAYMDPETGQLGTPSVLPSLTPEENAILNPEGQVRKIVNPDGSITVELNGACQEYSIMKIDANGNRTVECVTDPQEALQSPAPAAKPEER